MKNVRFISRINLRLLVLCWLAIVPVGLSHGQDANSQTDPIKESEFGKSLVAGKFILPAKKGWWNWGMAPIYDPQGRLHIFNSSIPYKGEKGMGFWQKKSIINHYVADSVEGPFELLGTAFSSDQRTYHNPQISKVGDTYVLVFLWKSVEKGSLQSIGMATAKSLDGPWTEHKDNPIILPKPGTPNSAHASNPSFLVDREGKFRIYYKSMSKGSKFREISVAIADQIEGPYVDSPENPLISYKEMRRDIEDPYAFFYRDAYYLIVEDRMDVASALGGNPSTDAKPGGNRPGLIFKSADGIQWNRPEFSYNTDAHYFKKELSRTERPHILWKDGNPEYLFLANHHSNEAGFYLKIEGWDPKLTDSTKPDSNSAEGATAKDSWEKLVGKRFIKRPQFAYLENNPALPNVLIYGDSISIHYTEVVRKQLKGKANVYRIFSNGQHSGVFVKKMKQMHEAMRDKELVDPWTFDWDLIHFNVGLHDLKYLAGKKLDKENGKQVTSVETYQQNLEKIVGYLGQSSPSAKLIFATTTPVTEGANERFAGDAEKYNAAAMKVLVNHPEITINDLFKLTKPNLAQWWIKPGDVHFNPVGRTAQGDQVARVIINELKKK